MWFQARQASALGFQTPQLFQVIDVIRYFLVKGEAASSELTVFLIRSDRISRHPRNPLSVCKYDIPNSPPYIASLPDQPRLTAVNPSEPK